jgi:hypothetical protein
MPRCCSRSTARDVIKVEPYEGDWSRMLGVRYGDHTAFSIGSNLGKRGIAVGLQDGGGPRDREPAGA